MTETAPTPPALLGRALSRYHIHESLGAGGMGEVFRAHDRKLGRDVALKVLSRGLLADEAARSRFRREADALSRLSHPHIATLLDFDSAEGLDFLVMELVTGPSPAEQLRHGPLAEKEVLRLGAQLARGLQAAHEQGIVHRDLKPANLRLTPDGLVKILDFGLARLDKPTKGSEEPTTTRTVEGRLMGTPAYMSPEQLRGRAIDARSDLYSAGALLYELATGRRPHADRAGVELFDAILHQDVAPPRSVRPSLSSGLEAIIVKLLDKDPELRYQSARELVVDLERLRESATRSGATSTPPLDDFRARHERRRRARWLGIGGGIGLVLLAVLAWPLWPPAPPRIREIRRLTAGLGPALAGGGGNWATVVSDGVRAYYIAVKGGVQGLWQVPIAGGESAPIPPAPPITDNGAPIYGYVRSQSALLKLAWEKDGDFTDEGMALWLVPVPTGPPRRIGRLRAMLAGVSPDEKRIAYATQDTLWLADLDGSNPRELLKPIRAVSGLRWSPDGTRLRYTALGEDGRLWIWETPVDHPSPHPLWPGKQGEWIPDRELYVFTRTEGGSRFGFALSASGTDLFAVPERRWPWWRRPEPVRLTFGPVRFQSPVASREGGPLLAWGEIPSSELRRLDRRTGHFEPLLEGTSAAYIQYSPDGNRVAWVSNPEGTLWRAGADGGERLQLTTAPLEVHRPRFSPDGKAIAFVGRIPGEPRKSLYVVAADGTDGGEPRLLSRPLAEEQECHEPCWAPDGQSLLFDHVHPGEMISSKPGLYRVGLTGAPAASEPGTETLVLESCAPQGHVLARDASTGLSLVRWSGRQDWEAGIPQWLASPVWTHDGRGVCGLAEGFLCYSFDRHELEVVADIDLPMLAVTNLPAVFLDPEDAPIVVVDRSTRDVYALEWDDS